MRRVRQGQIINATLRAAKTRSLTSVLIVLFLAGTYLYQQGVLTTLGFPSVHDGDTLTVNGQKFRLYGMDAPELAQTCTRDSQEWACGETARQYLVQLIGGQNVTCIAEGKTYERELGRCTAGGKDLSREMVLAGYALAYRQYSKELVPEEVEAKQQNKGIWSGTFQKPWEWRKHH